MTTPVSPAVERAIPTALVTRVGNPVLTWLLSAPRRASKVGQVLLLMHVTGRRSGRVYSTPVGYHRQSDGRLLVLTSSRWRVNLRGGPTPVQVTLLGHPRSATATLQEDPVAVSQVYEHLIEEFGVAKAGQRLGIRINVDRAPTHDELVEAVTREQLAVILLDLAGAPT